MTLLYPAALGGLALIPVLLVALHRSRGRRSRRPATLRLVALGLLVAAALGIVVHGPADARSLVFLVDVSAGMHRAGGRSARDLAADMAARTSGSEGEVAEAGEGALVLFAEDAVIASRDPRFYRDALPAVTPDPGATNIEAALQRVLGLMEDSPPTVVLLSDGVETHGNARRGAAMLAEQGVAVSVLPFLGGGGGGADAFVREVSAPTAVPAGRPVTLEVRLGATSPMQAEVMVSEAGVAVSARNVFIPEGSSRIAFEVPAGSPGLRELSVALYSPEDAVPGNNSGGAVVWVTGPRRVLVVAEGPSLLPGLLGRAGFEVESAGPAGLPASTAGLTRYSAVVLDDLPAYRLAPTTMDALESYVRDFGGGFLMVGGPGGFGAGGYLGTPVETILPVDMDVTASLKVPSLAMLFVIDKSGSMGAQNAQGVSKLDLVKEAVLTTVDIMNPLHRVGVLAFDADYEWAVPLIQAGRREEIAANLAGLETGGGTLLFEALEEAFLNLAETPAAVKHVIVLSDGLTGDADFEPLIRDMRGEGISISTVSIGANSDRALMGLIAEWGEGRTYLTRDVASVPRIFTSETTLVTQDLVVEETFFPELVDIPESLREVDFSLLPPLDGFLLTYEKPDARTVLRGPGDNPVLSLRRFGLGRSAAFTSDLRGLWSSAWLRWNELPSVVTGIMAYLTAGGPAASGVGPASPAEVSVEAELSGDEIHVELDLIEASGLYAVDRNPRLRLVYPSGETREADLEVRAPGRFGVTLAATGPGTFLGTIYEPDAGILGRFGAVRSYPRELLPTEGDAALLEEIAVRTGGRVLSGPEDLLEISSERSRRGVDLSPFIAIVALLVFLVDLAAAYLGGLPRRKAAEGEGGGPEGEATPLVGGYRNSYREYSPVGSSGGEADAR